MADPGRSGAAFDIEESARRVGHYEWIEQRLFEVLGGWVAEVPELEVKELLGRHCYHHAWHAELWHKCLPELESMSPDRFCAPPNDELVTFVGALSDADETGTTIEKLVGAYRVLIPAKIAVYSLHLDGSSTVTDAPTARWLDVVLRDEIADWRDGERLIRSLVGTEDEIERAARRQAALEKLVLAAGGITGS